KTTHFFLVFFIKIIILIMFWHMVPSLQLISTHYFIMAFNFISELYFTPFLLLNNHINFILIRLLFYRHYYSTLYIMCFRLSALCYLLYIVSFKLLVI